MGNLFMIKFKDFFPEFVSGTHLFKTPIGAKVELIPLVVKRVNNWVDSSAIEVINIETVVIPYLRDSKDIEEKSEITQQGLYIEYSNCWSQGIRVWYREK